MRDICNYIYIYIYIYIYPCCLWIRATNKGVWLASLLLFLLALSYLLVLCWKKNEEGGKEQERINVREVPPFGHGRIHDFFAFHSTFDNSPITS
jgi:hypothetical protein